MVGAVFRKISGGNHIRYFNQCHICITVHGRRFSSSGHGSNRSKIETGYKERTAFSFSKYYEWYSDDFATLVPSKYLPMIESKYFKHIKNKNNYLEVGCGRGVAVNQLAPYFDNKVCIIEPNTVFLDTTLSKLKENKAIKADVQVINSLIDDDDFDPKQHLDNNFKFDFINMQHVLWHVQLSKWDHVMNTLYGLLNSDGGVLNITQLAPVRTFYDIHTHFVPEMRTTDYIKDYFVNKKQLTIGKDIDIVNDVFTATLPESICVDVMVDMLITNYAIYDYHLNENGILVNKNNTNDQISKNDLEVAIKEYFAKDNLYSKDIDKNCGEHLVTLDIEQAHAVTYGIKTIT